MDKTKKIIIFSLTRQGCIEYTQEIIRSFKKAKPIVTVSESSKKYFSKPHHIIKTYNGFFSFIVNSFLFYFKSHSLLQRIVLTNKSPVIYCTSFHPWNYIIARFAKKHDIPFLLTIHDYNISEGLFSWWIDFIQKSTASLATNVIFLTHSEEGKYSKKELKENQTFVLPHPLFKADSVNKLPFKTNPNLLFFGYIKKSKGLDILIQSIENLNFNKLTIAGAGQLPRSVAKSNKVNIINRKLHDKEIESLFNTHEILILPYQEASQSGILSLGISKEMVMLITKLPGLQEQLSSQSACWTDNSITSIRSSLENLINSEEEYITIKKNIAEEKINLSAQWSSQVNSFLEMIDDLN